MRISVIVIYTVLSINSRNSGHSMPQNSNLIYRDEDQPNLSQNYAQLSGRNDISNQRISAQKCEEYSKTTKVSVRVGSLSLRPSMNTFTADQCDVSQGLIVGGENAKAGEFPHMAAIGYKDLNDEVSFKCGGSLISERYVLTVAHCKKRNPSLVRIGDLNLAVSEDGLPEEDIGIEEFIIHDQYDPNISVNDIAVIRLERDVKISKYIRPACLVQPNTVLRSNKAIATGWGSTKYFGGGSSDILQKVELDLFPNYKCNQIYENYVGGTQLCAGILQGGKDTCQGDSGGPLQTRSDENKCIHIIIGVTSYGLVVCGHENSPAIYTKVSPYLDWIESKVWGS